MNNARNYGPIEAWCYVSQYLMKFTDYCKYIKNHIVVPQLKEKQYNYRFSNILRNYQPRSPLPVTVHKNVMLDSYTGVPLMFFHLIDTVYFQGALIIIEFSPNDTTSFSKYILHDFY